MRRAALALVVCLPLAGCDLVNKITNDRVMVGMLVKTPLENYTPPGGFPVTVPAAGLAQVYLGDRASDGSSITGVDGAVVTVSWGNGSPVTLAPQGQGNYQAPFDPGNFGTGTTYTFTANVGGKTYWVSVLAPGDTGIDPFESSGTSPFVTLSASQLPLTITRTGDTAGTLGFYSVPQTSTCNNFPSAASDFVDLVLNQGKWKATSFSLTAADCFNAGPGAYVVEITNVKQGSSSSDNLSLGSSAFAGSAGYGVLVLTP